MLAHTEPLCGQFIRPLQVVPYTYVYQHYRLFNLPDSAWTTGLVAFVGVDFAYYW